MPLDVMLLVLLGALLHASWNASVKSGADKTLDASMVALGASVTAMVCLPFLPLPAMAAAPFILASMIIHFVYYQLVAAAYREGDIGLGYPLMRGTAPLIIAGFSGLVLGESLKLSAITGIAAISAGVLTLAAESRRGSTRAVMFALLNAMVIAFYTFVDGIGARLAGNSISYTLWISVLPPIPLYAFAVWRRSGPVVLAHLKARWWRGLLGGMASIGSYGLALWAMTKAPVATVAALRETSILFATLISVIILKERVSYARLIAAAMIATGALVLKLG